MLAVPIVRPRLLLPALLAGLAACTDSSMPAAAPRAPMRSRWRS